MTYNERMSKTKKKKTHAKEKQNGATAPAPKKKINKLFDTRTQNTITKIPHWDTQQGKIIWIFDFFFFCCAFFLPNHPASASQ